MKDALKQSPQLLADETLDSAQGGSLNAVQLRTEIQPGEAAQRLHGGGANFVLADGSVRTI